MHYKLFSWVTQAYHSDYGQYFSCTKISIFVKRILVMWPPKQWPAFEAGVTTMHCAHCSSKYSLKTQEAGKCGIKCRLPTVSRTLCMHILIPIISDLDRLVLCDIRRSIWTIKAKWCNFVGRETWEHVSVHWQQGKYQLWPNCFMGWLPVLNRGPQNLRDTPRRQLL